MAAREALLRGIHLVVVDVAVGLIVLGVLAGVPWGHFSFALELVVVPLMVLLAAGYFVVRVPPAHFAGGRGASVVFVVLIAIVACSLVSMPVLQRLQRCYAIPGSTEDRLWFEALVQGDHGPRLINDIHVFGLSLLFAYFVCLIPLRLLRVRWATQTSTLPLDRVP